jgi:pyridoxine/pyridoxamine 5'-phosphate oxidase
MEDILWAGKKTVMTTAFLYQFMSKHIYAVVSTVTKEHLPEAALVGIAVTQDLEIIFDTVSSSRKYENLMGHPAAALVIGWEHEQSIQYEGNAELITGDLLEVYFSVFPDGRERMKQMKGLVHFCVRPRWIRYSDFNNSQVEEMNF